MNCNFREKQIKLMGMACITFLIGSIFFKNFYLKINIVKTPSVKYKIFWVKTLNGNNIIQDQYVRIETDKIKSDLCHGKCLLVKRVGCPSGSLLVKKGYDYYCDDKKISRGLKDKTLFEYNGIIPDGKYFMIGDHKKSYDSKAVGFFDEKEINAILLPIF